MIDDCTSRESKRSLASNGDSRVPLGSFENFKTFRAEAPRLPYSSINFVVRLTYPTSNMKSSIDPSLEDDDDDAETGTAFIRH